MLSDPICWHVWVKVMLEGIYRAHGAHKIHVLDVGLGMRLIRGKHCLLRVGRTEL